MSKGQKEVNMKNHVQIKKGLLSVSDKSGNPVKLPSRVEFGMRNYRFDQDKQLLQKKCTNCKVYFDTDELIDGEFVDVHDENLIREHRGKSEMYSRCVECQDALKEEQILRDAKKMNIAIVENRASDEEVTGDVRESKNTMTLSEENTLYINLVAVLKGMTGEEYLNAAVEKLRRHDVLTFDFEEKIK